MLHVYHPCRRISIKCVSRTHLALEVVKHKSHKSSTVGITMSSLQTLRKALFDSYCEVFGGTLSFINLLTYTSQKSYELHLVISRVHYKHFARQCFLVVVKCLGELLVSLNFQQLLAKILKRWGFALHTPSWFLWSYEVFGNSCVHAFNSF